MRVRPLLFVCLLSLYFSATTFAWKPFGGGYKQQIGAEDIETDTSEFNTNLSSADDTVQKALDTLDEVAGGGGGSGDVTAVGDCATGACFNGTQGTTLTFNNAGGDATQVYDGTTMAFSKAIEMEGGNITYVDCGASIADAVTAATAGDTLVLGSCDYTLASTLAINKSLSLVCLNGTRILDGAAFSGEMIDVTASPFSIANCKLEYDSGATTGMIIDATATSVFNYKDVIIDSVSIIGTHTTGIEGIRGKDAGMIVINPQIILSTGLTGTNQCRTLFTHVESTAEADVEVYAIGGGLHKCSVSSAEATTVNKPLFCWNNGANESTNGITCNYENQVVVADNSVADAGITIAALVEGARTVGNFYGGVLDGGRHGSTSNARDLQTDGGASVANLYGTTLRRGYKVESTGTINTFGVIQGSGIYADNVYQAPDHVAATPLIDMAGQQGGDKPGTGATAGLTGAGVSMTLGSGGAATEATTTGTGGAGGSFSVTAGAGSDQTIATSTTNVGGAGGSFSLTAGAGGAANTAGTTNTGGNGGDFYIAGGAGGVGTTTNGADGDLILARTSGGTNVGNVGIGTASPVSKLDVSVTGGTTAANGGKLTLSRNDTTVSMSDRIGQIDFWNNDSSLSTQKYYASIYASAAQDITTDAAAGRLIFMTTGTTAGGAPAIRMLLSHQGYLGIGTTAPDVPLEVNLSTGGEIQLTYNDADGSATNKSNFKVGSSGDLTITASGGDISLDNENLSGTGIYDLGGASLEIPNSTSLPGTCVVGQVYMDTDATTGQRIYACESTNTWVLQGDGGGGGSGDVTDVGDCTTGACFNGTTGTTLTFNNAGGDARIAYDGTDVEFDKAVKILGSTANMLIVSGPSYPVELVERTPSAGTGAWATQNLKAKYSAGDVTAEFGPVTVYSFEDSGAVNNALGYIGGVRSGGDTSGALVFATYSSAVAGEAMRMMPGGKIGIGTTAPDKVVEINGASGGTLRLTYNDSNGSAATYGDFEVNSSGNLNITPSGGEVGIGNATPLYKLEVGDVSTATNTPFSAATGAVAVSYSANSTKFLGENTGADGTSSGSFIALVQTDGTAVASGNRLGGMQFGGHDGVDRVRLGGAVIAYANGTYSATAAPTKIDFEVASASSATRSAKLTVDENRVTMKDVMTLNPVASPPASPTSGDMYMDSGPTPDELCVYDGAGWQALITGTDANCA